MSLSSFKSQFKAAFRPNQFQVTLNFPTIAINGGDASSASTFFVRAAEIPGSTIGSVAVPYRGRFVKYSGDRTFTPWTVTIMNDDGFTIRKAIESWMNALDGHSTGAATAAGVQPAIYQKTMLVQQLQKNHVTNEIIDKVAPQDGLVWTFVNAFPIDMSPIQLDYANNDVIEEYTVTFDYDYWTTADTTL